MLNACETRAVAIATLAFICMLHTYYLMSEEQLSNLLGSLSLAITDAQAQAMGAATTLNASETAAIMTLGTSSGIRIDTLRGILRLSHSATVRLVEKLAGQGFVARTERTDRREVGLRLTPKGRALRRSLVQARNGVLDACIAEIPRADRAGFGRLVGRLLETLTTSRAGADHICRLCDESVCPAETCPVEQKAVVLEGSSP